MERWWCLDCRTSVELNSHARCENCNSEAVDTMERTNMCFNPTASSFMATSDVQATGLTVHLGTIRLELGSGPLTIEETVYIN